MNERDPKDQPLPDDETTTSPHGDELEDLVPGEDPGAADDEAASADDRRPTTDD